MKEIKICGITKQEEIEYLNELKVQYKRILLYYTIFHHLITP